MTLPTHVKIVEVGPRDGLQNEATSVTVEDKVTLIEKLAAAGLQYIECGAFVNPKWVPQMANSAAVFKQLKPQPNLTYAALVPNLQGLTRAIDAQVSEVAVFAAASEAFSQKNINCSIEESLARFKPVIAQALERKLPVRGYLSCVAGCPYEGQIAPSKVADVAQRLIDMGCYEVSLGDTIGVGSPASIKHMLDTVQSRITTEQLAVHFHDTYGMATANIYAALQHGIATIDSSVAGLGGCPYAEGASGNVATEDVVYLLNGFGIHHGVDLNALISAGSFINGVLSRQSGSKVAQALAPRRH